MCIVSCKKNSQKTSADNAFKVSIKIKVKENDKFQLFYVEDTKKESYTENKRITCSVNGKNNFQNVEFTLPPSVLPEKFRIDVGETKVNTLIEIEEVSINYRNKQVIISDNTFHRFFKPNIYLEKNKNGYMRKTIENRYDPFFISTALLNKRIELDFK
jgi:hypothetical protein